MSTVFDIAFAKSASIDGGLVVQLKLAGETAAAGASEADPANVAARAAGIAKFKAKAFSTLDILAPQGSPADRLVVIGLGKPGAMEALDWLKAGGTAAAAVKSADKLTVFLDAPRVGRRF